REKLFARQSQARQLGEQRFRSIERRQDEPVELLIGELRDRPHAKPEELTVAGRPEDADRLKAELLQRELRQLRRSTRAVERDALEASRRQVAQRLAKGLAGAAIEVERIAHMLIRETGLLGEALGRQ